MWASRVRHSQVMEAILPSAENGELKNGAPPSEHYFSHLGDDLARGYLLCLFLVHTDAIVCVACSSSPISSYVLHAWVL